MLHSIQHYSILNDFKRIIVIISIEIVLHHSLNVLDDCEKSYKMMTFDLDIWLNQSTKRINELTN